MRRWFWWLGPPLLAIALLLHFFASRPVAIEIAINSMGECRIGAPPFDQG